MCTLSPNERYFSETEVIKWHFFPIFFQDEGWLPEAVLNLLTYAGGAGFKVKDTRGMTLKELIKEVSHIPVYFIMLVVSKQWIRNGTAYNFQTLWLHNIFSCCWNLLNVQFSPSDLGFVRFDRARHLIAFCTLFLFHFPVWSHSTQHTLEQNGHF